MSEREKFYITSHYYHFVTGDLEKAAQTYQLWAETYPQDTTPVTDIGYLDGQIGQYDKGLTEAQKTFHMDPSGINYAAVVGAYLSLDRLSDAKAAVADAQAHHQDSPLNHINLYEVAFLEHDAAGMAREFAAFTGKPGVEDVLLYAESLTAAYSGQLGKARERSSRRAEASAERADEKETAAGYKADEALREALFGNAAQAKQRTTDALALATNRDILTAVALASATAGDSTRAQVIADDLAKRFPQDTLAQFNYLPEIGARIALVHGDTAKAIGLLEPASPYEMGTPAQDVFLNLYPVYVRGEAYLAARNPQAAAAEFQKVIDTPGIVINEPIGALAHVQLGRAYAISGDAAKAKNCLPRLLRPLERRRPRHPHPEGSQGGVCEAAIESKQLLGICFAKSDVRKLFPKIRVPKTLLQERH